METKTVGLMMMITSSSFFIYYTLWVAVTPLLSPNNHLQSYFPERKWAILIPCALGVCVLCFLLTFVGITMVKSKKVRSVKLD